MAELGQLISLATAHNTYWTVYIAVAGALLGYQTSGKPFSQLLSTKLAISIIFAAFALGNWNVIDDTDEARRSLRAEIDSQHLLDPERVTANHTAAAYRLKATNCREGLAALHAGLDLLVILGLWRFPALASTDQPSPRKRSLLQRARSLRRQSLRHSRAA